MSTPVEYHRRGAIGVTTITNPPVNALSVAVRQGIADGLAQAAADAQAKAVVIIGGGRTFIAGADIREFGKPRQPPALNEGIRRLEQSPKPVVAALHGPAPGGGLGGARGCPYRCAAA